MLVPILGVAAAAVAGVVGFAATRANQFRVQRTKHIKASPDRVFGKLTDFRNWPEWSPWEQIDPSMTKAYTGSQSGAGALYEWEGNRKVGLKPFEAHNTAEYLLEPRDGGTDVSMSMDKMVGNDFEKGLNKLGALCETH